MRIDPQFIDRLYEAAIIGDRLPLAMQEIADKAGAVGAMFMSRTPSLAQAVASPGIELAVQAYIDEGWAARADHAGPLFREMHPGFRAEAYYHSPEEIARMPVHAEFMDPCGLTAGTGTVLQGAADHLMHFTLEGFRSHEAAGAAVPLLDALRPDLARVLTLASLRRQQSRVVVDSLALAGVGAAIVGGERRLRTVNDLFVTKMGNLIAEDRSGARFASKFVQAQFEAALAKHRRENGTIQSIAIRSPDDGPSFALHLVPIRGAARDVCDSDGVLLIIADGANAGTPNADLLRLLFDLTPAEARLTRLLVEGRAPAQAAKVLGITEATVRTHLRRVFAKTGVQRQAELVRLLMELRGPA